MISRIIINALNTIIQTILFKAILNESHDDNNLQSVTIDESILENA